MVISEEKLCGRVKMKFRIVKQENSITGNITYAVEQQIGESLGDRDWVLFPYYNEKNEHKWAIFDTIKEAETFIECDGKPLVLTTIKEIVK